MYHLMDYSDKVLVKNCSIICTREFYCDWAKWTNEYKYQFPDGTSQTCVGAQVRCECNLAMSFASIFTYEHPSAIILTFLFLGLVISLMLIRCLVLGVCGGDGTFHPIYSRNKRATRRGSFEDPCDVQLEHPTVLGSSHNLEIFFERKPSTPTPPALDPPPPYSSVCVPAAGTGTKEDLPPPPQYSECVRKE